MSADTARLNALEALVRKQGQVVFFTTGPVQGTVEISISNQPLRDALDTATGAYPVERLPTWEDCRDHVRYGIATPLEEFVFNGEPARPGDMPWRAQLAALLGIDP